MARPRTQTPPPELTGIGSWPTALGSSFCHCRRLSARSRSSFRFAFGLLPRPQADAMHALYAYLRITDDLADGPGELAMKRARLADWRRQLTEALNGICSHRTHAALNHIAHRYGIPEAELSAPIDGGERDLTGEPFRTFDELQRYCQQVAGVVGRACVRIWGLKPGVTWEQAEPFTDAAGLAFQLTNILRDLTEDRVAGRVYLPQDELNRFDCPPDRWANTPQFRELLRFQVERADGFYRQSEPLTELLAPHGRVVFNLMNRAYRGLLERVALAGPGVLSRRVRLTRGAKFGLLLRAWAHTWTG
ncbi:MAG: phytoene/squalene synthase family protein [Fimbriiglobus sp.]|nr:phytoene/squalene synthase family protein [Fimbriiglobus sp.]